MNASELERAVKEIIGKDPIETCINYYKGLIQISADRIAEEQKTIHKLQKRIRELTYAKDRIATIRKATPSKGEA